MDPPEFRTSRSRANSLGLRPESDVGTRSVKIWAGPSRRPSGINALTFGRAKITLKLTSQTLKQPRVSANDRLYLAGRLARETFRIRSECGLFSPANRPARNSGATPRGEAYNNEPDQSGRARAGIWLRHALTSGILNPASVSKSTSKRQNL